jgi:hypothetical protein
LLQFEHDRRDGITPSLEMLAREVLLSTAQSGNGNGALSFENPVRRHQNDNFTTTNKIFLETAYACRLGQFMLVVISSSSSYF